MIKKEKLEKIKFYIEHSKSENTRKAYSSDWADFTDWCEFHHLDSLPASVETVGMYIADLADRCKLSTIQRRLSSIGEAHKMKKLPNPTKHHEIFLLIAGIKKEKGGRQESKKALLLPVLQDVIDRIDTSTLIGVRDKALILTGFALASRRSELVAINLEDISFNDLGVDIRINETKTGQEELIKAIVFAHNDYCPVKALKSWISLANIGSGPIFCSVDRHGNIKGRLHDKSVATIVKKYIQQLGLDANTYAAHSLRSGLSTSAAMYGMNDTSIMKQTGHKTRAMVDRYVQDGMRYKNNASSILKHLE